MAATASSPLDNQLQTLAAGFDALQQEFQRLYNKCQSLESSLETAKAQYAGLTSQCPHKAEPLDLPDTSLDLGSPLPLKPAVFSKIADSVQRNKITSASRLSQQIRTLASAATNGVAIHTGPAADRPSACNSAMPSISESPLEQDFTVEGTPSKLGCPFAAMANRKLSSHAASVVSRYRSGSRSGAETPRSSVSRINGRDSSVARASFTDPIKAETCAMESHGKPQDVEAEVQAASGVCPIRFLDQHSPEEVAAYFELHKHELPRSHEVCVKRYQSNEESIRALDAKYGNLVSMITGLGHKHTPLLPGKIDGEERDAPQPEELDQPDHLSDDKIRKWASSVDTDVADVELTEAESLDDEERQARFDRPLRDVRLGESPSRPWGIQVPFRVVRRESAMSVASAPGPARKHIPELPPIAAARPTPPRNDTKETAMPARKCPFGFDAAAKEEKPAQTSQEIPAPAVPAPTPLPDSVPRDRVEPEAAFINPAPAHINTEGKGVTSPAPQMVFTGPVFIGYSLEQAMSLLQTSKEFQGVAEQERE